MDERPLPAGHVARPERVAVALGHVRARGIAYVGEDVALLDGGTQDFPVEVRVYGTPALAHEGDGRVVKRVAVAPGYAPAMGVVHAVREELSQVGVGVDGALRVEGKQLAHACAPYVGSCALGTGREGHRGDMRRRGRSWCHSTYTSCPSPSNGVWRASPPLSGGYVTQYGPVVRNGLQSPQLAKRGGGSSRTRTAPSRGIRCAARLHLEARGGLTGLPDATAAPVARSPSLWWIAVCLVTCCPPRLASWRSLL